MGRVARLGVLGGTFDPPHYGHLILAEVAHDQLDLDRVIWVPAADPPHKEGQPITPARHRLAMLDIALSANSQFVISRVDMDRPGPHYTVDLLDVLRSENPAAQLFFLMGGDSLRDLPSWHEPSRLVEKCTLAVMPRPGYDYNLDELQQQVPGLSEHVVFLEAPQIDLSATDIGKRVQAGRTIRYLVPPGVEDYIEAHGLYRARDARPA